MTGEITETEHLISSSKIEGTPVYDTKGERLGAIEHFMVDKVSGKAAYAVLSFGGVLGIGHHHYPLPWEVLAYDKDRGGYVVDVDKDAIEQAPSFDPDQAPEFDRDYGKELYGYYGVVNSY